jgi:hypothetical protein
MVKRYGPLLCWLGLVSGCGHRAPDALLLIEVQHQDACAPQTCVQNAERLEKLLAVQLGARSNCDRIHAFQSRNEWMLAQTPPQAKHWTLTVSEHAAGREPMSWQLSGPGKTFQGAGDPRRLVKDVCGLID